MPHFDIANQSRLLKARWADYFAALTIAYAGEALYAAKEEPLLREKFPEAFRTQPPNTVSNIGWGLALEAMDAVCFAEAIASETSALRVPVPDAAARGRRGGLIRAAKYSDLNDKVINLYKTKYQTSPSNRQAARCILSELSKDDLSVLNTDDPQKRLEKWIGEQKKREQRET